MRLPSQPPTWPLLTLSRYGRKLVLTLAIFGTLLDLVWFDLVCFFPQTLPIELVWLAPAAQLIGAGNAGANAAGLSLLADVLPESNR